MIQTVRRRLIEGLPEDRRHGAAFGGTLGAIAGERLVATDEGISYTVGAAVAE